jgi:tetratricopeptide (TPR) repeat protein
MAALLEILIIFLIVMIIAVSIGIIKYWWIAIFFIALLFGLILFLKKEEIKNARKISDEGLLEKQVKFYDFVFKTITVVLALAAIFLYKDRQEMKRNLEEDFDNYKNNLVHEVDSLKSTSVGLYHQLDSLNKIAQKTKTDITVILNGCKSEYNRFSMIREKMENESYNNEQNGTFFSGLQLKYIKKDSMDNAFDAAYYNNISATLGRKGMLDEAKKYLHIALSKDKKCKNALWNLGYIYFVRDSLEKALESTDKLIEYYQDDGECYFIKAQCLYKLKRKEEAKINLQLAIKYGCKDFASIIAHFGSDDEFKQYIPKELQ